MANSEFSVTRVSQYPTQAFVDKVAKNHAYAVMTSSIDFDNKVIHYCVAKDDTRSVDVDVTFDEACEMFGWNSFTTNENKTLLFPVISNYEPTPDVDEYKKIDEHFNEPDYNWMSQNRITTPMNNSMEGIGEINAQLHQNGGIYYGKFSHPIGEDFLDGLVLAEQGQAYQTAE